MSLHMKFRLKGSRSLCLQLLIFAQKIKTLVHIPHFKIVLWLQKKFCLQWLISVVHDECATHFHMLWRCSKPLPPSLSPSCQEKGILPAGEIFIAIQKTCSSIKCVSGVVYSRTLQKQTASEHTACTMLSCNLFKEKHCHCFLVLLTSLVIFTPQSYP